MATFGQNFGSSRLGRSIVTAVATAQANASQTTTPVGSQTRQVRVITTITNGIWCSLALRQLPPPQALTTSCPPIGKPTSQSHRDSAWPSSALVPLPAMLVYRSVSDSFGCRRP
jgi:hypothetical protein